MKYLGSKQRIAKYIVPIIQQTIDETHANTFVEPFVGGCNVIDKVRCNHKIGIDKDRYLIALLKHVQDGLPLYDEVTKDLYDKARKAYQQNDTSELSEWEIGCIGHLASYNGRFFEGGYAKPVYEHTPKGDRYRDYYKEGKQGLLKQAEKDGFKYIDFVCGDYKDYSDFERTVIYCDPPYEGKKSYDKNLTIDYTEFWNWVRTMSEKNIVFVSELQAPDDFECIWKQEISRTIKVNDKSKSIEKLFRKKD